jgi:hypothetical protein
MTQSNASDIGFLFIAHFVEVSDKVIVLWKLRGSLPKFLGALKPSVCASLSGENAD